MKVYKIILTLLCPLHFCFAAESNFQKNLDSWRTQNQITSVVVSVADLNSDHVSNYASGTTLMNGKMPVTANLLYGVGSISKTFVAASILQLQEEGKLKLTDSLGQYLPEYPRWKEITLQQVLNMTSGIPNFTESPQFKTFSNSNPQTLIPPAQLINMAYAMPDYFVPGQGWHYSNTDYYLLGLVIEKVTGQPLEAVFKQRFFKPLKLNHTFYSTAFYPKSVETKMAHAYMGKQDVTNFNAGLYGPAGGMVMDSHDLVTWTHALFTPGIILNQASLNQLMTTIPVPPSPLKPLGAAYGLGIYSLNVQGIGLVWYYAGVIDGYTSILMWVPAKNEIIVAQVASWPNGHYEVLFPNQPLIQKILAEFSGS